MLLAGLAFLILLSGFVARRLNLSESLKRRLALIGSATAFAVLGLSWLKLGPLALLALFGGAALAGMRVMQEIGGRGDFQDFAGGTAPPPRPTRGMDREEALAILGLEGEPEEEAILAAHKRMIIRAHPDQGGSDYLAAKVNQAKAALLPKN